MTRLIEDLLDATRITSGKIQLQREILDLNELAQKTVEDYRGAFVDNQIALEMLAPRQRSGRTVTGRASRR